MYATTDKSHFLEFWSHNFLGKIDFHKCPEICIIWSIRLSIHIWKKISSILIYIWEATSYCKDLAVKIVNYLTRSRAVSKCMRNFEIIINPLRNTYWPLSIHFLFGPSLAAIIIQHDINLSLKTQLCWFYLLQEYTPRHISFYQSFSY